MTLPRFKIESRFDLPPQLQALGMTDAFGPKADFSGMLPDRAIHLAVVAHKGFVEVNEEGTEAAGATGASGEDSAPPTFHANHPFLFLIRDAKHGTILFVGRVTNPKG